MIYLIITTSIFNKEGVQNADLRQRRYIDCIQSVLTVIDKDAPFVKPIIVENNGNRTTFLDDLCCDVVYTNNNVFYWKHKGVNELMDIKDVIQRYNIQDDDVVIKMTGRYKIKDSFFFDIVKEKSTEYDAFVKFFNVCTLKYMENDCVLGLFAIKCKYLKDFSYQCIKSGECEFADHVRKRVPRENILEMKDLRLECCFADDLRILNV